MPQNWQEFGDFLLFAEDLGCQVFVNTVISQPHCSLYYPPPEDIARIADEMVTRGSSMPGRLHLNKQVWEETVDKLHRHANESQADRLTKTLESFQYAREEEDCVVMARKLMDKGQCVEALKEVLKTPLNHSSYYHSVVLSGHIRHLLGDLGGAERDFDRAQKLSSLRPEVFLSRALLRIDQNRIEDGLEDALCARELVKKGDDFEPQVCEVLSLLYRRQGKVAEAITVLDRWRDLQPQNPKT
jgi:tetratricopeptide (TPR) repeat protein